MRIKRTLATLALVIGLGGFLLTAEAGSLSELGTAVNNYYASGGITDADVKSTLSELIAKASATSNPDSQTSYRESFVDVVNAFSGSGITSEAAAALRTLAQP